MNDVYNVRLETSRLILREVRIEDKDDFESLRLSTQMDPNTIQGIWYDYKSDSAKLCADAVSDQKENPRKRTFLAITLKDSPDKFIGFIKTMLEEMIWEGKPAYVDLSYNIHADYQNNGYVSEAAFAFIDYLFKTFNFDYINATSHIKNRPSHKVLYRLGFKRHGGVVKKYNSSRSKFELTKEDFYKALSKR
ncbi:MAG: GNAT family N-acetyltransferase [Alphaproteobacteria bacterium]|nr:GNAT family N-acetyltransferase [Alphaproteobacteria bacterium]MCL2504666.1 GNAT family N-acetyltransferase [Alphaproteobacteria bacterium]